MNQLPISEFLPRTFGTADPRLSERDRRHVAAYVAAAVREREARMARIREALPIAARVLQGPRPDVEDVEARLAACEIWEALVT